MADMEIDPELAAQMGFSAFGSTTDTREQHRKRKAQPPSPDSTNRGRGRGKRGGHRGGSGGSRGAHPRPAQHHPPTGARLDDAGGARGPDVRDADAPGYTSDTPPPAPAAAAVANPDEVMLEMSDDEAGAAEAKPAEAVVAPAAHGLPPRPGPPAPLDGSLHQQQQSGGPVVTAQPGKKPDGSWDWDALRRGVRNADGDMVYFDRAFIEDPWAKLLPPDSN